MRIYLVGCTEIEFLPDEPPFKLFGTYDEAWAEASLDANWHVGDAELDVSRIEDARDAYRHDAKGLFQECDDYAATHSSGICVGLSLALKLLKSDYKESNDSNEQRVKNEYNNYINNLRGLP